MTPLKPLTIVRAGAGAGKTYRIKTEVGEWVKDHRVRPERVMAVTFTEAAASELRARLTAELLRLGRIEDALKLSQAYISTIHGFGLRVLREFTFEAGTSPDPRLLAEDEQRALIRRTLAETDYIDFIPRDLAAYGYKYDFTRKQHAGEQLRNRLREILELLRSINVASKERLRIICRATEQNLIESYGPIQDPVRLQQSLHESVDALLTAFPTGAHQWPENAALTNKAALKQFRQNFRDLQRARNSDALGRDWILWENLRKLRTKIGRKQMRQDYVDLADAVMAAADGILKHPGPRDTAVQHVTGLLAAAYSCLDTYQTLKREAGVVDYKDMIASSARLIREREDVRHELAQRIDCMVVDEFQDTNPLQAALLWTMREAEIPTLVVGDLKQAIMGFQGADPRLFEALAAGHDTDVLPFNWRSQPRLLEVCNAFGSVLFGDKYEPLAPKSDTRLLAPLEFVLFETRPQKNVHKIRALAVGRRLQKLLADGARIVDRFTMQQRTIRGSDFAILCRTNNMLRQYAEVLRQLGLNVNLNEDGWYSSRAVEIMRHALAYVADPEDLHAALYLSATELGSNTLEEALRQVIDHAGEPEASLPALRGPLLRRLDSLRDDGASGKTVHIVTALVLGTLKLLDTIKSWPDSEQQQANLVKLLAKAREFTSADPWALACGGYYGSGIQTFLSWLEAQATHDDAQPQKKVLDQDAIVLRTWHGSKGLEWPVVVVAGLEDWPKERLPTFEPDYASFEKLSRMLLDTGIKHLPKYAAAEKNQEAMEQLRNSETQTAQRLLYVALTRARNKLIIEWPAYLGSRASSSFWSLLHQGRCRLDAINRTFEIGSRTFANCVITKGGAQYPDEQTTQQNAEHTVLPTVGRRAIRPRTVPAERTRDSTSPSKLHTDDHEVPALPTKTVTLGDGLHLASDFPLSEGNRIDKNTLGTVLHRCFEVLGQRPDHAQRLSELTGHDIAEDKARAIAAAVQQFEAWVASALMPEAILREWPLLGLVEGGTVMSGTADVIVRNSRGVWVLDHKSDDVDDCGRAFQKYQKQVSAYVQMLSAQQETVLGAGIHWIRRGKVTYIAY